MDVHVEVLPEESTRSTCDSRMTCVVSEMLDEMISGLVPAND